MLERSIEIPGTVYCVNSADSFSTGRIMTVYLTGTTVTGSLYRGTWILPPLGTSLGNSLTRSSSIWSGGIASIANGNNAKINPVQAWWVQCWIQSKIIDQSHTIPWWSGSHSPVSVSYQHRNYPKNPSWSVVLNMIFNFNHVSKALLTDKIDWQQQYSETS